jgi:hypothetical protein
VRHHTKDKGDEGLGQVIADLMTNGIQVAVPLSEHLPFDLIAVGEDGAMRRVQVRYRASADAAHLRCRLGGWWADRHGNLRLSKARNGQVKRTRDALEYRDPWRMFRPVPQSAEAQTGMRLEPGLESVLFEEPGGDLHAIVQ